MAALAVTLAGGAYVPLDPAYPAARLAAMAEDAGVGVVLADRPLPEELSSVRLDVLRLDDLAPVLARQSPEPPAAAIAPESLAYVMFTSGSTGRPKGVAVCHRAILRLVRRPDYAHLGQEDPFCRLLDGRSVAPGETLPISPEAAGLFLGISAEGEEVQHLSLTLREVVPRQGMPAAVFELQVRMLSRRMEGALITAQAAGLATVSPDCHPLSLEMAGPLTIAGSSREEGRTIDVRGQGRVKMVVRMEYGR